MRLRFALVAAPLLATCAPSADGVHVSLAPSLVFPRGLLQSVARVTIKEYYANTTGCDATTGQLQHPSATPDATTTLSQTGCTGGAVWCGTMKIDEADSPRIFGAEADDGSGNAVAVGCTQAVVNQGELPLTIAMRRALHPGNCQGDSIETETCDPSAGTGMVCGSDCQTKEELLSGGKNNPGPTGGGAGDHTQPAIVWPSGAAPAGYFVAFWADKTQKPDTHVALRVLGDDMNTLPKGSAPALVGGSIWLTSIPNSFPTAPDPSTQQWPAVAYRNDAKRYVVVFADQATGNFDIHLRTLDANFSADSSSPTGINGTSPDGGGESTVETRPAIAIGPGGKAYIAWQSAAQAGAGQIVGRTYDILSKAYGPQVVLSTGQANQNVSVAARSDGWIVAWQSAAEIVMRSVDANGKPAAAASVVSQGHSGQQEHPSVASIGGGDDRFAIAWAEHDSGNVFVQRYDASLTPRADDATTAVDNLVQGNATSPSIAGSSSGFFAVAWIDGASGHVRARLLDGTAGFDFNDVTGQNDEFQVSVADGRTRANPVVAVGGSGPFVAFAWEDQSGSSPGVYARRFPLPP